MRPRLTAAALALLAATALSPLAPAWAQDATPAPLGIADCTVDPIDPASYVAAINAATPAPPLPATADGEPADESTVAAVTDTMRQSVACTNAGDLGRLLAVIDPAYAPTLLGVPFDQIPAAVDAAAATSATPVAVATPLTDDLDDTSLISSLLSITDVRVLPEAFFNGQVACTVVISRPDIAVVTATVYLRQEGDRYVITNYVYTQELATPVS